MHLLLLYSSPCCIPNNGYCISPIFLPSCQINMQKRILLSIFLAFYQTKPNGNDPYKAINNCNQTSFIDWKIINKASRHMNKYISTKYRNAIHTILCLVSSLSFSAFALSYSPFSKCRWSGLSLESVGGSFSLIRYQIPGIRQS